MNLLSTVVSICALVTFFFTVGGFCIKVFTRRPAEEVIADLLHPSRPLPHAPPAPAPAAVTSPEPPSDTQTPRWSVRRSVPHPWLLGASVLGLLLIFLSKDSLNPANPFAGLAIALISVGFLLFEGSWIASAFIAQRDGNWVWFVAIWLTFGYVVTPLFSIFGHPKKKKQVMASTVGDKGTVKSPPDEPSLPQT